MPKHPQNDKLNIKIGRFFEASANGRFAIVAMVIVIFGYFAGRAFGYW